MTDGALGEALTHALQLEKAARAHWQAAPAAAEREAALMVVRHTTAVIKSLEQWMTTRADALQM